MIDSNSVTIFSKDVDVAQRVHQNELPPPWWPKTTQGNPLRCSPLHSSVIHTYRCTRGANPYGDVIVDANQRKVTMRQPSGTDRDAISFSVIQRSQRGFALIIGKTENRQAS